MTQIPSVERPKQEKFFQEDIVTDLEIVIGNELSENGFGNRNSHRVSVSGIQVEPVLEYKGGDEEVYNLTGQYKNEKGASRTVTVELLPVEDDKSELNLGRFVRRAESVQVRDITETRALRVGNLEIRKKIIYKQMEQAGQPVVEVETGDTYITQFITESVNYGEGKFVGEEVTVMVGTAEVRPNAYIFSQLPDGTWSKALVFISPKTGKVIRDSDSDITGYDLNRLPVSLEEIDLVEQFKSGNEMSVTDPDHKLIEFVGKEIKREDGIIEN